MPHATSYSRATLLAATTRATAGLHKLFASTGDYFSLRRDNLRLLEQIARLETQQAARPVADSVTVDSLTAASPYYFTTARIISNSIARQENFFVIDKGSLEGVEENMGVLTPDGAVAGYVRQCSDRYAVCVSVLNRAFTIGGRFLHNEYFGSVGWDGTDARFVTLTDIPRYAEVSVGDTVVSAYSLRFPPDRFIGTVAGVEASEDGTTPPHPPAAGRPHDGPLPCRAGALCRLRRTRRTGRSLLFGYRQYPQNPESPCTASSNIP